AALEAALCAGCDRRRDGACAQWRRRIPLRQRHRRLLRLDARPSVALARFHLARRARGGLADPVGRLHHDALWQEGRARGTRGDVSAISAYWLESLRRSRASPFETALRASSP